MGFLDNLVTIFNAATNLQQQQNTKLGKQTQIVANAIKNYHKPAKQETCPYCKEKVWINRVVTDTYVGPWNRYCNKCKKWF